MWHAWYIREMCTCIYCLFSYCYVTSVRTTAPSDNSIAVNNNNNNNNNNNTGFWVGNLKARR